MIKSFKKHQQNESWMFNGDGDPVFIGNQQNTSQFDPSGSVSPGSNYVPDEVARMLMRESGLRKGETISKRVIESYLVSMNLPRNLSAEVAMVIRNVYGVTPTEESMNFRSGSLIQEISGAIGSSEIFEKESLSESDMISSYIQNEFIQSSDSNYDLALGALATLSISEFCELVDFHDWVGEAAFNYIESVVVNDSVDSANAIVEAICWPSRVRFMSEHVQNLLSEDAVDDLVKAGTAKTRARSSATKKLINTKKPMKIPAIKKREAAVPSFKKQLARHGQDLPGDKLSKKPGQAYASFKAKKQLENPPKEPSPSKMKKAGSVAVGIMKKVADFARTKSSLNPDVGPALKKTASVAGKIAGGAGKVVSATAVGAAGLGGKMIGAGIRGLAKGMIGKKSASDDHDGDDSPMSKSRNSKGTKKPGLVLRAGGHIARAIGGFVKHIATQAADGFKDATPGIQSQISKSKESSKGQIKAPVISDSLHSDRKVLRESAFNSGSRVGYADVQSYKQFRKRKENDLEAVAGFTSKSKMNSDSHGDEYDSTRDNSKSYKIAKDFMTPHAAGTTVPGDGDYTTRMFSDPEDRKKQRKDKLADVMAALNLMRQKAADANVPPEGMFLDLYRDMHREKIRYS